MKNHFIPVLILFAASWAQGATTDAPSPIVNLRVKGENEELAEGFAKAFSSLKSVPMHVLIEREGGEPTVIPDIKRVTAAGAVLILETGRGLVYVVRPRDIVWFSDAPAAKVSTTR